MLIAKTRRDVEAAIREGEQTGSLCHPIHVTNAARTHTVAIRGYARSVHFAERGHEDRKYIKWYNRLDRTDSAQAAEALDDITDWLLGPELAGDDSHFYPRR